MNASVESPVKRSTARALTGEGRGWSLQGRLALLTFFLLAVVILAFGTAVYQSVRRADLARAVERLNGVARELALSSARSNGTRSALLLRVAASEEAARVLDASPRSNAPSRAIGEALGPRAASSGTGALAGNPARSGISAYRSPVALPATPLTHAG